MERKPSVRLRACAFCTFLALTTPQNAVASWPADLAGRAADSWDVERAVMIGSFIGIVLSPLLSVIAAVLAARRGARIGWRQVLWMAAAGAGASMIATYVLVALVELGFGWRFPKVALGIGVIPVAAAVFAVSKVAGVCAPHRKGGGPARNCLDARRGLRPNT